MGGPAGKLPGAQTYKGRQHITGIIGNMVLVDSSFPHAKEFLRNIIRHLDTRTQKSSPALSQAEKVERISGLRGARLLACPRHQNNGLPGVPTSLWPALTATPKAPATIPQKSHRHTQNTCIFSKSAVRTSGTSRTSSQSERERQTSRKREILDVCDNTLSNINCC